MKMTVFFSAKLKVALMALTTGLGGHLSAGSGQAGALTGTLREKCTAEPLTCVRVALVRPTDHAEVASSRTDAAGSFHLRDIPAGTYVLRTDLLGYEPLEREVSFGRRAVRRLGTVALAPVAEEQALVRPELNEPVAQVSRGVAVGRW